MFLPCFSRPSILVGRDAWAAESSRNRNSPGKMATAFQQVNRNNSRATVGAKTRVAWHFERGTLEVSLKAFECDCVLFYPCPSFTGTCLTWRFEKKRKWFSKSVRVLFQGEQRERRRGGRDDTDASPLISRRLYGCGPLG